MVSDSPPNLVAGDVLQTLPRLLQDIPDNAATCVFSTLTLYQLGEENIIQLRKPLGKFSKKRPIQWLSGDPQSELDNPTYRHVAFSNGIAEETQLAEYESYGKWVRWLADDGK